MITRVNLELKYFCPDFKPIRQVLKKLGAKKIGFKKQTDYFFYLPSNKKIARMKYRDEGKNHEIVYYERANFHSLKNTNSDVLIHTVKDKTILNFLKGALGVRGVVQKTREIWKKDHTVFHLDIVKNIGKVFEIELRKPKSQPTTQQDLNIFKSYKQQVFPYLGKIIKTSNLEVVLKNKNS